MISIYVHSPAEWLLRGPLSDIDLPSPTPTPRLSPLSPQRLEDTQEPLPLPIIGIRVRRFSHSSSSSRLAIRRSNPAAQESRSGVEAVGATVLVALGDVVVAAAAAVGGGRGLVRLVQAQHLEARARVLQRVPPELRRRRD